MHLDCGVVVFVYIVSEMLGDMQLLSVENRLTACEIGWVSDRLTDCMSSSNFLSVAEDVHPEIWQTAS